MNAYMVRCISLACSDDIDCFPAFLYTTVCMGEYLPPNHIDRSIRTAIQTYHTITVQAIQVFFERIFRISFRIFFYSSCSSRTVIEENLIHETKALFNMHMSLPLSYSLSWANL